MATWCLCVGDELKADFLQFKRKYFIQNKHRFIYSTLCLSWYFFSLVPPTLSLSLVLSIHVCLFLSSSVSLSISLSSHFSLYLSFSLSLSHVAPSKCLCLSPLSMSPSPCLHLYLSPCVCVSLFLLKSLVPSFSVCLSPTSLSLSVSILLFESLTVSVSIVCLLFFSLLPPLFSVSSYVFPTPHPISQCPSVSLPLSLSILSVCLSLNHHPHQCRPSICLSLLLPVYLSPHLSL